VPVASQDSPRRWSAEVAGFAGWLALVAPLFLSAPLHAQERVIESCSATAGLAGPSAATCSTMDMAPATALDRYSVIAGDQLDIFVWGEESMQRQVRVQPDGTFAFPLAGTVRASGRNVTEISDEIRERIAVNYRSEPPDVTVTVRDAMGIRFYVIGKVNAPGSFTSGTPLNILQALSMAGGTAEFADVDDAVILRQTPTGQIVEPVELKKLLRGGRSLESGALSEPLPTLATGDVLVIP